MQYRKMIVVEGASFVFGALAFVFAFSFLAVNFNDHPMPGYVNPKLLEVPGEVVCGSGA